MRLFFRILGGDALMSWQKGLRLCGTGRVGWGGFFALLLLMPVLVAIGETPIVPARLRPVPSYIHCVLELGTG